MENILEEEIVKLRQDRNSAYGLLGNLMKCGWRDVEVILEMERIWLDAIEMAQEIAEDVGGPVGFGHFVMAWKEKAIESVEEDITEKQVDALRDMIIDDNYCAWGCVASYGEGMEEEAQEAFSDYVRSGEDDDRQAFLNTLKGEDDE